MDEEEDDIYGAAQAIGSQGETANGHAQLDGQDVQMKQEGVQEEDDGEDDQEDDDSDSDIDIITERKNEPVQSQSIKRVKQEPVRISSADSIPTQRALQQSSFKSETPAPTRKVGVKDGSKYPEFRTSTLDIDAIPIYEPAGKAITEVDLDADIANDIKPWRVPGTDPTDFYNYGFDEFTWVQYCLKQTTMRETVGGLKNETKEFETMLSGQPQGMPSMPGMPPGMDGMNPEMMNAMLSSMQAQGMDPSQLDFNTFMQHMGPMMPGMPGPGGPGGQFGQMPQQQGGQDFGGGFGGQQMQNGSGQGYGGGSPFNGQQMQGTPQPQSFEGYSPQQIAMLQGSQGGGRGGQGGGRGRGRGRRW